MSEVIPTAERKEIAITNISPNDYNPQEMAKDKYKGLVSHIRAVGFQSPLVVRERIADDPESIKTEYVLVDGEHRLRAFMEVFADAKEIPCTVMKKADGKPFTRHEAIISTIAFNHQRGEENPIKMAAALKMALDGGMIMEDIEDLTGMKRNRIESFLDFDSLPDVDTAPPKFEGSDNEAGSPIKTKDPIIMSFAVYPEMRDGIEKAISKARAELPSETDIDEERGKCLEIICEAYTKTPEDNA